MNPAAPHPGIPFRLSVSELSTAFLPLKKLTDRLQDALANVEPVAEEKEEEMPARVALAAGVEVHVPEHERDGDADKADEQREAKVAACRVRLRNEERDARQNVDYVRQRANCRMGGAESVRDEIL